MLIKSCLFVSIQVTELNDRLITGTASSIFEANMTNGGLKHLANQRTNVSNGCGRGLKRPSTAIRPSSRENHEGGKDGAPSLSKVRLSTRTERVIRAPKIKIRQGPSNEALLLSEELKELSRQKKLDEALALYRSPSKKNILDGHHACIIVDCCARCGSFAEGEQIVKELVDSGTHVNVETKTALMKGFAHSGQIAKADNLFSSMCSEKARVDRPNVRTVNTILRGCLWSAASTDENGIVTGGVTTAEKIWKLCQDLHAKGKKSVFFDVSSYEYSISLLCQALRTDEAITRIEDMKEYFSVSEDTSKISQSVSEALALSYLALMRAFAILGEDEKVNSSCQSFWKFASSAKKALTETTDGVSVEPPSKQARYAMKQGKESAGSRRGESNVLYRNHRINEAEKDAQLISDMCGSHIILRSPRQLARRLATRLLFLRGGGSSDADTKEPSTLGQGRLAQIQFLNTVFFSFGLQVILKALGVAVKDDTTFLRKKDCNRILGAIGLQGGIVLANGVLDINRIFRIGIGEGESNKKQRKVSGRLEIELGSGFGDWIVRKAQDNPSTNFLSVELRSDRVWHTFARTVLLSGTSPVDNLCVVGADGTSFLSTQIQEGSVSAIYINHPEPPTQTFGADSWNVQSIANGGPEPAHMVTTHMMKAASKCLSRNCESRLIIVTDNKWYGYLICATLVKLIKRERGLLFPVTLGGTYSVVKSFPSDSPDGDVQLYEGNPGSEFGYSDASEFQNQEGHTYFDRLWRTGAGSHAEKSSRFIICASRESQQP